MSTIKFKGLAFQVEIQPDNGGMGAPWDEHDGHGDVRHVRDVSDKKPGERILGEAGGRDWYYFYDWQGAMAKARRDGWGLDADDTAALSKKLGHPAKSGEILVEAVQRDFDYCRRWLADEWYWCGVVVTLLDTHGEPTSETESVWGVESDATAYLDELARESTAEIASRVGRRTYLETKTRVRK